MSDLVTTIEVPVVSFLFIHGWMLVFYVCLIHLIPSLDLGVGLFLRLHVSDTSWVVSSLVSTFYFIFLHGCDLAKSGKSFAAGSRFSHFILSWVIHGLLFGA